MRGHNAALEGVCEVYASLVAPCERFRDMRVAQAWHTFDRAMMTAAREANRTGDWRSHERVWTAAQADRAKLTSAAWATYRNATSATNNWFLDRLGRVL